jgi:hypothetical protein
LVLGPGQRGPARAFNPRPKTGSGWSRVQLSGFFPFFLFKRISNDDLPFFLNFGLQVL